MRVAKQRDFLQTATHTADVILTGGGVLCTLAWFYFFYHYVWTAERQFTSPAGTAVCLFFPGFLAGVFFASLRLRPAYRVNLALLSFSLTVSIYGIEILLLGYHKFVARFDTRTRLEVITDLRNRGIDAVPPVFAPALLRQQEDGTLKSPISIGGAEVLPLAGISHKTTVLCNESGEWITYRSDGYGFHNPEGVPHSRRIGIAALGDSFTVGVCVPPGENFVDLIRMTNPSTVNLGVDGAGPLIELAAMREYCSFFLPEVTLWFYFEGNDLSDLNKEKKSPLLVRYLEDGFDQGLVTRQNDIDRALTEHIDGLLEFQLTRKPSRKYFDYGLETIKLSALRRRLGLLYGTSRRDDSFESGPNGLFREVLQRACALAHAWNSSLYFVYLPHWDRYASPRPPSHHRDAVLALVRDLKIPIIDIHQAFQDHGDPLSLFPYRKEGHYNARGHRLVAETVLQAISRRYPRP